MHPSGLAVLVVVGLWLAYLVPQRLRHRQQLLDSRTEDRFSGELRVLAVAARSRRSDTTSAVPGQRVDDAARGALLTPTRGIESRVVERGVAVMNRPHELRDREDAQLVRRYTGERSQRAAALARRAAGARRRAVLTLVLLLGSVGAWLGVAFGPVAAGWALAPTVAFGAVLVLGRRAAVLNAQADAAWAARVVSAPVRSPQRSVTGRATTPSDTATAAMRRVASARGTVAVDAPALAGEAGSAETWAPVEVPRPTYTLKPAAPRREPAPLPVVAAPAEQSEVAVEAPVASGGLDLDAILERRRAAGE